MVTPAAGDLTKSRYVVVVATAEVPDLRLDGAAPQHSTVVVR